MANPNLTGLVAYVDQLSSKKIMKQSVLEGTTIKSVYVQPDVKHIDALNYMSAPITLQAGACGWNAAGDTVLTQKNLEVDTVRINEEMCIDSFEKYYTGLLMNAGSYNEKMPLEQIWVDIKKENIQRINEDLVWKSNKSTGSGNLALSNGFLMRLDAAITAGVTGSVPMTGTFSIASKSTELFNTVDAMIAKQDVDTLGSQDLTLYMSPSDLVIYSKIARDKNSYHYDGTELTHPGTGVKILSTPGLIGTNALVLSPASNLVVGTDLLNDSEAFQLWFDMKTDTVCFKAKWKIGTQIIFEKYVTYFKGV